MGGYSYSGIVATRVLPSNEMATEVVDSVEGLEWLANQWRELWWADPSATPFQSPDWLIPWTRHLWGGGKLRVFTVRQYGRLTALAPFFLWGFGGRPQVLRLSFLGSGISDYLDMVCAPECAAEATGAVLARLTDGEAEWDVCDLQELRACSPLLRCAGVKHNGCSVCPMLPLRGSLREQLRGVDGTFRRSLRTAEKRLRERGAVEFVRADAGSCDRLLHRLFELHAGRWYERGERGMFATDRLRAFHRETAARFCAQGILRLYGLMVDGQPVAVQYNFAAKRRAYAYQAGFDVAWGRESPGAVLLAHSIDDAIAEGAREFDFLRRPEPFKYAWGAVDAFTSRLVFGRGAEGCYTRV